MIPTVLLVLALFCFALDTFGVRARVKLTPLGLALYIASILLIGR